MCGIAGILRYDQAPVDPRLLAAMRDRLQHRGPDGQGLTLLDPCGLAHTRRSILDHAGGAQPMQLTQRGDDGALAVVFNGEIYNHRDLRHTLAGLGHVFTSDHSDTEVLLHGYRQWGTDLPRRLLGMFAFAIWDQREHSLLLARDPLGKKPLFYRDDQQCCAFASEIPALLLPDWPRRIDQQALQRYLQLGYAGYDSLILGIHELPPAHWLRLRPGARAQLACYWSPDAADNPDVPTPASDPSKLLAQLEELLTQAVARRLEADVPLGCFLSGGIDSTLIAALAQRTLQRLGKPPLRTFSVRMPDARYDESAVAQETARMLGTEHHTLDATLSGDLDGELRYLMASYGEPTADSSLLPTYWLSRAVSRQAKVALSGDGGDELFGGYDRYRALRLLGQVRPLVKMLPPTLGAGVPARSWRGRLSRLIDAAGPGTPGEQYRRMIHLFTDEQLVELGLRGEPMPLPDWPTDDHDRVRAAMAWDRTHYLPQEVLRKVDRASMAVGLEVRCPLLDAQVAAFAQRIPTARLLPGGRPKALLRALVRQLVGPAVARLPKRGFAIPIGSWLGTSCRDILHRHLTDGTLESLGLSAAPARRWLEEHQSGRADHTHRLFALWQLSLWDKWLRSLYA